MVYEKKIWGNIILIIKCVFSRIYEVNYLFNGVGDVNIVLCFMYCNCVIWFYIDVIFSNFKIFFGKFLMLGLIEYYIIYEKYVVLKWFVLLNR